MSLCASDLSWSDCLTESCCCRFFLGLVVVLGFISLQEYVKLLVRVKVTETKKYLSCRKISCIDIKLNNMSI